MSRRSRRSWGRHARLEQVVTVVVLIAIVVTVVVFLFVYHDFPFRVA